MADEDRIEEGLIYHYTTHDGHKGIIENKCIWATNVNFLNDFSEYNHGVKIIKQEVDKLSIQPEALSALEINPTDTAAYLARGMILGNVQDCLRNSHFSHLTFVASFFDTPTKSSGSENGDPGDNLGQWRAYSHDTPGFSIGFDKRILDEAVSGHTADYPGYWTVTGNCTYKPDVKTALVKRIPEAFKPILRTLLREDLQEFFVQTGKEFAALMPERVSEERLQQLVFHANELLQTKGDFENSRKVTDEAYRHFLGELMVQPALMKDEAFEAENEWRIVRFNTDPSNIEFRTTKSGFVPFVKIPIKNDDCSLIEGLIKSVTVGPFLSASFRETQNAVMATSMLLKRNGLEILGPTSSAGVMVKPSRIPFRS